MTAWAGHILRKLLAITPARQADDAALFAGLLARRRFGGHHIGAGAAIAGVRNMPLRNAPSIGGRTHPAFAQNGFAQGLSGGFPGQAAYWAPWQGLMQQRSPGGVGPSVGAIGQGFGGLPQGGNGGLWLGGGMVPDQGLFAGTDTGFGLAGLTAGVAGANMMWPGFQQQAFAPIVTNYTLGDSMGNSALSGYAGGVKSAAVNGMSVAGAIRELDSLKRGDVADVYLGTAGAIHGEKRDTVRASVSKFLDRAKELGISINHWILPIQSTRASDQARDGMRVAIAESIQAFNQENPGLRPIRIVDLNSEEIELGDGVHYSAKGAKQVIDFITRLDQQIDAGWVF
jgi:hypothetical protein